MAHFEQSNHHSERGRKLNLFRRESNESIGDASGLAQIRMTHKTVKMRLSGTDLNVRFATVQYSLTLINKSEFARFFTTLARISHEGIKESG